MSKITLLSRLCGKKLSTLFFFYLLSITAIYAQESITVNGKITDEKGQAIPAVLLKLKVPRKAYLPM
ncbi:hypothetical protein SAMN05443550_103317 [Pedobacter hartonius]|uniref:Uncharacterized protein n=1 Tax=Pedobacter hartonius TaxID=425514 RepID=A0A1H4BEH5_9SPHI|nr:hypothetical protein SAMN05443550_103317 [Pedobacter hartonius]